MATKYEKARVNIYLSEEVKQYYKNKAAEMGLSMSQYMHMALKQQMEQEQMIKTLPDMIEKLKDIEEQQVRLSETIKKDGKA